MNYRFWTQEEVAILEEMYSRKDIFASDIAARSGRSVEQVYRKAMSLGLKRPWANSNGYYVATSIEEARNWSESARERARAIWAVADAVEAQSDGRLFI